MKRVLGILNVLNGLILVFFVLRMFGFISIAPQFTMMHLIVVVLAIYGLRIFIESQYDVSDGVKENRIARMSYYLGTAALCIGVLFKIMLWPLAGFLVLIGSFGVLMSYVIGLILPADLKTRTRNEEILDDL
ncbi:hypothetical protein [Crocinitomix catalasitica]|uniref:hypothetical protein n=1 Tax=Crocinitomix catalasitica TaxID=184607 RepID=UPI0004804D16|nr:hypothetical protein [Crocinitomix catalasitica]